MMKKEIESAVYDAIVKYGSPFVVDLVKLRLSQPIKVKLIGKSDEIEIDALICCSDSLYKTVFFYSQTDGTKNYFDRISINSQRKILDYINKNFKKLNYD